MHWVYLSLDLGTLVLFALTLHHALRRGSGSLLELLTAAVYGLLLEWGDITIFGTYTYSTGFPLRLGPVPITIGLCWAMIIYGGMLYSDQLGLPGWVAPFADALWAILLDLAFDAVAIRLGFWHWNIPLNQGYFGVPAGNFSAWLYVALGFSVTTRLVRRRVNRRALWQLLTPIASFILLLGGILLFDALVWLFYPRTPGDKGMLIFVLETLVFAAITTFGVLRRRRRIQPGVDLLPTLTRVVMHLYFGGWLLLWAIFPRTRLPGMDLPPFLIWMALALLFVEGLLTRPLIPPRPRALWRSLQRSTPVSDS